MRWNELLQLPVMMEPLELETENLSSRQSASNKSQSLDFKFSSRYSFTSGSLLLHMSHIFIEIRSRVTILRVPSMKATSQQLVMIQLRKLLWSLGLSKLIVWAWLMEVLVSLNCRAPLLVPRMNKLSVLGWSWEQVILSLFCALGVLGGDSCLRRQGWWWCSMLHRRTLASLVAKIYCWLCDICRVLRGEQPLLGMVFFKLTEIIGCCYYQHQDMVCCCVLFSQSFHSLMELELEVSIL